MPYMIPDLVINAGQYSSLEKMPRVKCKINIMPIKYSLLLPNAFNNIQVIPFFFSFTNTDYTNSISVECVGKKCHAHNIRVVIIPPYPKYTAIETPPPPPPPPPPTHTHTHTYGRIQAYKINDDIPAIIEIRFFLIVFCIKILRYFNTIC